MDTSPFSASTTDNWVARAGGLPDYVRGVAHALLRKGRAVDEAHAISMAVGLMQDWASGRTSNGKGHVHPAVQAAAAKALAQWEAMRGSAHAHAGDFPALEMAGAFNEALHPRVAKGNAGGGRFGAGNTPLTAGARGPVRLSPPPAQAPETPADLARMRQLRFQASQDRHLARQILVKVAGLVRTRDGYVAGLLNANGTAKTSVTSPAKKAAAAKAAATKKTSVKKTTKKAASKTTAAATKAATVRKMNGQIGLLRGDARALIKSANHLDAQANGL